MVIRKTTHNKNLTWINIDSVNEESIDFLKKEYNFHELDLEDVQEEHQTPKIDTYKDYLFIILQFPYWDEQTKKVEAHQVSIFIGNGFLITIQKEKILELNKIFNRCSKKRTTQKEWMEQGPGFLLYNIIETMFIGSKPIIKNIRRNINKVENEIFEDNNPDARSVYELAKQRRNVLSFRRIIDPQRYLMSNLSNIRKTFLNENMSIYFDDVNDYLTKLWSIINSFKDTIDGLHVTVESLLTRRTNKVIGALTVISVSLLPLSLLASIYGMNIALPFSEKPILVWLMFGATLCTILITIIIMKNKKWL